MRNKTLDNRISKLEVIGRHEPLSTSMTSMIEDATVQWGAQPDDLHSALSQMEMKVTVAGLPYFSADLEDLETSNRLARWIATGNQWGHNHAE